MGYVPQNIPETPTIHNRILIGTGVPGSGKDFLLTRLARKQKAKSEVGIVQFGEALFNHLQTVYPYLKMRDDMRTMLSQDQVKQGVIDLVGWLIQNQPLILNTHVVYRQNNVLTSNPDVDQQLNAKGYVFVWADPQQILQWRISDTMRLRPQETVEDIAHHQEVALQTVVALAQQFGSGLTTIWNRNDNVNANVATLLRLAQDLIL